MEQVATGPITKMRTTGKVPGKGTGDKIPAKYTPGEFVVSKKMLKKAPGLLEMLKKLRSESLPAGKSVAKADKEATKGGVLKAADGFYQPEKPVNTSLFSNAPQAPKSNNFGDNTMGQGQTAAPPAPPKMVSPPVIPFAPQQSTAPPPISIAPRSAQPGANVSAFGTAPSMTPATPPTPSAPANPATAPVIPFAPQASPAASAPISIAQRPVPAGANVSAFGTAPPAPAPVVAQVRPQVAPQPVAGPVSQLGRSAASRAADEAAVRQMNEEAMLASGSAPSSNPLAPITNILTGQAARGGKSIEEYYGEQGSAPALEQASVSGPGRRPTPPATAQATPQATAPATPEQPQAQPQAPGAISALAQGRVDAYGNSLAAADDMNASADRMKADRLALEASGQKGLDASVAAAKGIEASMADEAAERKARIDLGSIATTPAAEAARAVAAQTIQALNQRRAAREAQSSETGRARMQNETTQRGQDVQAASSRYSTDASSKSAADRSSIERGQLAINQNADQRKASQENLLLGAIQKWQAAKTPEEKSEALANLQIIRGKAEGQVGRYRATVVKDAMGNETVQMVDTVSGAAMSPQGGGPQGKLVKGAISEVGGRKAQWDGSKWVEIK